MNDTNQTPNKDQNVIKKTRSKKYQDKTKSVQKKNYLLNEALELLEKTSYTKFDPSIELHFNLSIDPKKSDQMIRIISKMPHGIKKELKILVFGNEKELEEAKKAGATYLGNAETITKIKNGWLDFDKILASPEKMPQIASLARILGPKGLMPNPKNNTVTTKIKETIENLISGNTLEIKNEKDFPIVHVKVGKLSFGKGKIKDNMLSVYNAVLKAKPNKAKNPYVKSLILTSTMGPGINIELSSLS